MKIDQLQKMGLDIVPGARNKQGVEFYTICPFCEKKGKSADGYKLGFNVKTGVYHCYRCQSRGKIKDIKELAILAFYSDESDYSMDSFLKKLYPEKFNSDLPHFDLDLISYKFGEGETPIAFKYMTETRKYSSEEISKYNLRVGKTYKDPLTGEIISKWAGRVIFPYFYEGQCIYLVGRSYTGKEPKYLNVAAPKGLVVYGLEEVQGKVLILCEGIISAHAAQRYSGIPAVAVLGKDPLEGQLTRIRHKCQMVYLGFDGDVDLSKRMTLATRLSKMGVEVWDIELPNGQDPDSLREDYLEYFKKAKKLSLF